MNFKFLRNNREMLFLLVLAMGLRYTHATSCSTNSGSATVETLTATRINASPFTLTECEPDESNSPSYAVVEVDKTDSDLIINTLTLLAADFSTGTTIQVEYFSNGVNGVVDMTSGISVTDINYDEVSRITVVYPALAGPYVESRSVSMTHLGSNTLCEDNTNTSYPSSLVLTEGNEVTKLFSDKTGNESTCKTSLFSGDANNPAIKMKILNFSGTNFKCFGKNAAGTLIEMEIGTSNNSDFVQFIGVSEM